MHSFNQLSLIRKNTKLRLNKFIRMMHQRPKCHTRYCLWCRIFAHAITSTWLIKTLVILPKRIWWCLTMLLYEVISWLHFINYISTNNLRQSKFFRISIEPLSTIIWLGNLLQIRIPNLLGITNNLILPDPQ